MSIRPNVEKLNKIFDEMEKQPPADVVDPEFPPAERNVWNGPGGQLFYIKSSPCIPPNWNGDVDDIPGFR